MDKTSPVFAVTIYQSREPPRNIKRALLHGWEKKLQLKLVQVNLQTDSSSELNDTATMVFQYKRVLLVGATAGIGAAMADKLVEEGAKVIAVGRRQERLDAFVAKHGPERASAIKYDVTDRAGLDAFVNK